MIDVLLKALLLIILITAFSLGVGLWIAEGRFSKELMNSTTIEQDAGSLNGSPASIELIEEQIKKQLRWQLLFMAWFYPAKILIQTVIKSRRWQLLIYLFNAAVATVWIWGHRINWESNIGETIYFMIIGEPVLFLFIPTVFFSYDWINKHVRRPGSLILQMPLEILFFFPWSHFWGMTMSGFGWL